MTGKLIGYIRVSSLEQNPDRQLENIKLDKKFIDKVSGSKADRPKLQALLDYIRDGDTLIVHSMDRLARNLDDLRKIVKSLVANQVKVKFLKENLEFTGEDSPMANLLLSVMGAFAEFERSIIRERQKEGIELAKRRGIYKGRAKSLNIEQTEELKNLANQGIPKTILAKKFSISRDSVYKYLRQMT